MKRLSNFFNTSYIMRLKITILFLIITASAYSQRNVSGTITDASGFPLPGVNVIVKDTQKGTVTNLQGYYQIIVENENSVLQFSYVGFESQEIRVDDRDEISLILKEDTRLLDEVVVIGYGKQKKSDLSGSVAVVDMDELESIPITSAGEALKGRAAGVLVTSNSGQPGSAPNILIRGKSSISAGNNPLVVVDGIPGASLSDVDFRDVVAVTVLKDAASAAIYGSAGANGVILVTTKRGESGKNLIEFRSFFEIKTPPRKIELLGSEDAFELMKEIDLESGDAIPYLGDQYISNIMIDTTNLVETDWQDQLFRSTAPTQSYALSFSGGNDDINYRISGSYTKDVGYIRPSESERFSLRSNLDYTFSEKLRMLTDFALIRSDQRSVSTGDFAWNGTSMLTAMNTLPFLPIYAEDGSFFINPLQPNIDIPNAGIADNNSHNYQTRLIGRYGLYYELIDGLSYTFEFMPTVTLNKSESYTSKHYTYIGRSVNGRASSGASDNVRYDMNHLLKYSLQLKNHNLDLMGGFVMESSTNRSRNASGSGFLTDSIPHVINTVNSNGSSGFAEYSKYSYVARASYNFNSRYFLQLNLRADGSSRFGVNKRWGTFPSASAAWRISQERFLSNSNWVTELKVRGTVGITGNDMFSNYLNVSTYTSGANYPIWGTDDVAAGYVPSSLYNPNLKWEEQFEKSLGLDLSLWKGRIDFVAEVYVKDSYDLLYNASPPIESGFSSAWLNIGEVQSKGYDLMLTTHNISKKDLSWRTNVTFSVNHTKVMSLGDLTESQFSGRDGEYIITPGEYIDAFYGWEMTGIYQNPEEISVMNTVLADGTPVYYQNELTSPGDVIFANTNGYETNEDGEFLLDANGNPYSVVNSNDRKVIGKPHPDFFYGVDNTLSYKNFELNVFLQGVYGNDILSLTRREIERMDHYFNYSAVTLDRWKYEGQETNVPRPTTADPNENNRISTRWMEDGSYLRVKYVTLSYNFPDRIISNIGLSRCRIYFTLNNLYTFTNYSLYDPEIATNGRGTDMGGYPQARSYTFGLNISL